jgi:hypothetical protein
VRDQKSEELWKGGGIDDPRFLPHGKCQSEERGLRPRPIPIRVQMGGEDQAFCTAKEAEETRNVPPTGFWNLIAHEDCGEG